MAIRNITPNRGLNGNNPLAYMGVNPSTPAEDYTISRDPDVNDWQGYALLDTWLNTTSLNAWVLVSLYNNQATWIKYINGGVSPVLSLINTDGNLAITDTAGVYTVNFSPVITVQSGVITINGGMQAGSTASGSGLGLFSSFATLRSNGVGGTVLPGNGLGGFLAFGFDGTQYTSGGGMTLHVDPAGTVTNHQMPTILNLVTSPNSPLSGPGYNSLVRMIISSAGNVTINAPDSGVALNSISTYGQSVGATQSIMVIDNAGNIGTNGTFGISTGTFTPTMVFASPGTITYSSQTGKYTVIGNIVYYNATIAFSSIGASAGNAFVGGLPFTILAAAPLAQDGALNTSNMTLSAGYGSFWVIGVGGGTTLSLQQGGSAVPSIAVTSSAFASGPWVVTVVGSYFTS